MTERYYGRLDSERGWLDRVEDRRSGVSMRFVQQWDASADQVPSQFDVEILRQTTKVRLMNSEPVLVIVGGGTALVQIGLQLLAKFGGLDITPEMNAALASLAGLLLASWARNRVTPMNTLPAGVAGKIADAKAAKG